MSETVLVVDPHLVFRRALLGVLARLAGVGAVVDSGDPGAVAALVQQHSPDVILLDLPLPGDVVPVAGRLPRPGDDAEADLARSIGALRALKDEDPARRVFALMDSDRPDDLINAVRAGADGTLCRHAPRVELVARLRGLLSGRTVVRNEVMAQLAAALKAEDARVPRDLRMLTDSERAVLGFVALGHSDRLIARDLHLDEMQVSGHMDRLLRRLSFRSRVEAAAWAGQQGATRLSSALIAEV